MRLFTLAYVTLQFLCFAARSQSFVIDIASTTASVVQGTPLNLNINGIPSGGFSSSIQLSMANTCFNTSDVTFSPGTFMNPPYNAQVVINNTNYYMVGTYKLLIKGVNGPITSYDSVMITIQPNPGEQWFHFNLNKYGFSGSYFVNDVETDSQNNYWMSVWSFGWGGICKYNGNTFETWANAKHSVYDMCGNLISSVNDNLFPTFSKGPMALKIDPSDNIWFFDGRITEFNPGLGVLFQSTTYTASLSSPPSVKMKAINFNTKQFYVAIKTEALLEYNGSSYSKYTTSNSLLPSVNFNGIDIDNTGALWVATDNGLAKYAGSFWSIYNTTNSTIGNNDIKSVNASKTGTVMFSTPGTLNTYNGTSFNSVVSISNLKGIEYDQSGNLWGFSGAPANLTKISPTYNITNYSQCTLKYESCSLPADLLDVCIDKNNSVFVGSSNTNINHGDLMIQNTWKPFVLGISGNNTLLKENLYVYPNPTTQDITFKNLPEEDYALTIYNALGQLVMSTSMNNLLTINISELKQGVYLAELNNEKGTFRTKFVKN